MDNNTVLNQIKDYCDGLSKRFEEEKKQREEEKKQREEERNKDQERIRILEEKTTKFEK